MTVFEPRDIDPRVYQAITLGHQLKAVNEKVWDAIVDGKRVEIRIDGELVGEWNQT